MATSLYIPPFQDTKAIELVRPTLCGAKEFTLGLATPSFLTVTPGVNPLLYGPTLAYDQT